MAKVVFTHVYEVPDGHNFIAFNRNGLCVLFQNPPVRDFVSGEWVDSVDGSRGTILDFEEWSSSMRKYGDLKTRPNIWQGGVVDAFPHRRHAKKGKGRYKQFKEAGEGI